MTIPLIAFIYQIKGVLSNGHIFEELNLVFSLKPMALFHTRLFFRIISKNQQVYALKVVTLAITFACATLVAIFSFNEFGYDQFHQNADAVFRIIKKNNNQEFDGNRLSNRIAPEVYKLLKHQANDHMTLARSKVMDELSVIAHEKRFHDQKIHAVDPEIIDIFSFELLSGDLKQFQNSPRTLLISASQAHLYFGTTEAVGQEIKIYTFGDTLTYSVAAIFKDYPQNSHEAFQTFIPLEQNSIENLKFDPNDTRVYGRMNKGNLADYESDFNYLLHSKELIYQFQPIAEIYFGPKVIGEDARHGDQYSIIILVCITTLILILALTSYINLTTLTLPNRAKELAVKKLAGTSQFNLLWTLAAESFVVTGTSLALGIWLLFMTSNWIESVLSIDVISLLTSGDIKLIIIMLLLLLVIGIAPLFIAQRFTKSTPNRLLSTDAITFPRFKKVIIFIQLGISMFLIVASMVIKRQINYSLLKEPGRNHDQVVYLNYPNNLTNEQLLNLQLNWKNQNPNILNVIATSQLPDRIASKALDSDFYFISVDPYFQEFFNLKMSEGRWFMANDGDSIVVVNKKGREILEDHNQNIIGVIEDLSGPFNLPEKPLKINTASHFNYNFLCIKVLEVDVRKTIAYLSNYFKENGQPATISFMNRRFEEWLKYQDRLNTLSQFLTLIAVVLSCCAVYGLSLSLIRDKLKQIAIRKTCGASTFNITHLLVKEFAKQMLVAILFFAPVTYILLKELLRTFVYSTKLSWFDPIFPLAYCALIIVILCGVQALSLNRTDLSSALKG